ncbi:shufflon system plasmid conjugative transfer pilus tip adhesin PilV [Cupriavidus sp. D39]|uniref:shufflon system plasmid conjugative transfer pilus tip adhesin PilV n=1 Tax=Cupriavidus sp. D39 TaxID=2997877 RepID=UPI002271E532|nr:shufflon system plasmid conjugative transfer pilus tip adhesin PilV [Cupriavidus sp. D39]MCY0853030.1 shufflon system plasmid conjugative transfer pilus tip adhesin PilV [Cupriavidus sp. D39]
MKNTQRRKGRGFISVEVAMGIIIVIALMTTMSSWINSDVDRKVNATAASSATTVLQATQKWMGDNYATILASANPYVAYDTTALAGYLPSGFAATNVYQQGYSIRINKVAANRLEALVVTTGGETIKETSLRQIAQLIGGQGGYVSATNAAQATGSFGGWNYALGTYGGSPGAGKLALALAFQDGTAVDPGDYLHRKVVAGRPEYNRMETAIDMAGNNLNAVGTVNATTVAATGQVSGANLAISNDARIGQETYTGGWFRTQGDSGWYSQKWGGGLYMSDTQWIRAYNNAGIYSPSEVQSSYINSNGRVRAGEYLQLDGWAGEGGWCSTNGLVGRDANGRILSCQSGVWQGASASAIIGGPVGGGSDTAIGVTVTSRKTFIITASAQQAGGSVTAQIVVDGSACPTVGDTSVVSGGSWSVQSLGVCQVTLDPGWHVFSTNNSRYSGSGYGSSIQYFGI